MKNAIRKGGGIFAYLKMRKKKYNQFLLRNAFNLYNMEVLKHFGTENYTRRLDIV